MDSIKAVVWLVCGATLMVGSVVRAAEYPCPSDPGFCYRDLGDDGCFESGTDIGPINAEIEMSTSFPVVPEPGSIVCPPSVKKIQSVAGEDIYLETAPGSSILIYAARVLAQDFLTISGDRLLLGGRVDCAGTLSRHLAAGDVDIEKGGKATPSVSPNPTFEVTSTTGDIRVGPKSKFSAGKLVSLEAPLGNVVLEEGVRISAKGGSSRTDLTVSAGGDVEMTRASLNVIGDTSSWIVIQGSNIRLSKRTTVKSRARTSPLVFRILAPGGDVNIERLGMSISPWLTVEGANVTIGIEQNGRVGKSRITTKSLRPVDVVATGAIAINRLALNASADVRIETTGTTIDILDSKLSGKGATPTIEVTAGPGSTCDLTGTTVKNATLVTNCDTVVGP